MSLFRCALWIAALGAGACVSDSPSFTPSTDADDSFHLQCEPGAFLSCLCNDATVGEQECLFNGVELGPCICGDGSTGPQDTGSSSSGGVPAECGDGIVHSSEQCDDGNENDEDDCSNDCIARCGLVWSVMGGGDGNSGEANAVAVAANGTLIATGRLASGVGVGDAWVAHYRSDGTVIWSRRYDLGADSSGSGVAITPEGNIAFTGRVGAQENADLFAMLLDDEGEEIWRRTYAGLAEDFDSGTGIVAGEAGVVVAGTVREAIGDSDLWLRSYSNEGDIEWTESHSGAGARGFSLDVAGPLAIGSQGTIFATVAIYSDFDTLDARILAYRSGGGSSPWTATPLEGGAHLHRPSSIAVEPAGTVVMTITDDSNATFTLVRYDQIGGELLRLSAEDLGITEEGYLAEGIGSDGDGDLGIVGRSTSNGTDAAAFTLRAQPDGAAICQGSFIPAFDVAVPRGAAVNSVGDIFAAGTIGPDLPQSRPWLARFRR